MTATPVPVPGDAEKKAYELAVDVVKQLITLATGITTVSVTFAKDGAPAVLRVAWVLYLVSVAIGIFAMGKLGGNLATRKDFNIYEPGARTFPILQQLLFVAATGCIVAASGRPSPHSPATSGVPMLCTPSSDAAAGTP